MKVLFTHSWFLALDKKQSQHAQPYPPLGTLLAASVARKNGFDVVFHDSTFCKSPAEIIPVLEKERPDVFVIYDDGFNYLTKMCLSNMREAAFKMLKFAKSFGCRSIVGSSDATDHFEKYIQNGAEFVLPGEGELALAELLTAIENKESIYNQIEGIRFISDGILQNTKPRKINKNLDSLPLPAWDLLDIAPYRHVWMTRHRFMSINIATTRGCPYSCNWCAKPLYGDSYNMRSPESVITEIKLLKQKFDIDHIWFSDDIFGLKRSWVTRFAELVKENNLTLRFKIQSRADLLVQTNYVEDLAKAGCSEVWMGAESGSQKVLDAMDKGTNVGQIKTAREILKRHGIRAAFFLQFGYPGEDLNDISKTIALVEETMPDDIGVSVSYPLPGTLFYENVKNQIGVKSNWSDSDDLSIMFRQTFPAEFYKELHRYVHARYRFQKIRSSRKIAFNVQGIKKMIGLPLYSFLKFKHRHRLRRSVKNADISF